MSYNYRCSKKSVCGQRRTLPKKIEEYVRRPKCLGCKRDSLTFDPAVRRQTKKRTCHCDGLHYPHRNGTEPWCNHAELGPTEDDYHERYRQAG